MDDVARAAGVSKAAVSKVIRHAYGVSPAMRKKVEETINELGYRPRIAARVMRGSSFSIGLEIPNLGNDFFTQIMQGAAERLDGTGYQLMITPGVGELSGTRVLENLADRQVDGMIAISPDVSPEWLENLASEIPLVLIGRHDQSSEYDTVTSDDLHGTNLAVDHLLTLGHKKIAHLTIPSQTKYSDALLPHTVRQREYDRLMHQNGLEPVIGLCSPRGEDAYEVTQDLLKSRPDITAVFAGNDTLAVDALRAIADTGLTADDVSVVGYDDIPMAGHPLVSLSTITQFGEAVGTTAINLLLDRINGSRSEARHRELRPELRVRTSSRPVRHSK